MTKGLSAWDLEQLELKDLLSRWFFTCQGKQEAWPWLGLVTRETAHGVSSIQPSSWISYVVAQSSSVNAPASNMGTAWPFMAWSWESRGITCHCSCKAHPESRKETNAHFSMEDVSKKFAAMF